MWLFTRLLPPHRCLHPRSALCSRRHLAHLSTTGSAPTSWFTLPLPSSLPSSAYTITTSRGSGPGGQGVNSSSNKVQMRVSLQKLAAYVHPAVLSYARETMTVVSAQRHSTIHKARGNDATRQATVEDSDAKARKIDGDHDGATGEEEEDDEGVLLVSSHTHRSAHYNCKACIEEVLQCLMEGARRLEAAAAEAKELQRQPAWIPTVAASHSVKRAMEKRRKSGRGRRMTMEARKGRW